MTAAENIFSIWVFLGDLLRDRCALIIMASKIERIDEPAGSVPKLCYSSQMWAIPRGPGVEAEPVTGPGVTVRLRVPPLSGTESLQLC